MVPLLDLPSLSNNQFIQPLLFIEHSFESNFRNFAAKANRLIAVRRLAEGGKSGQHRVPYFLTGRVRLLADTESATEN
jgi:hypothetical protein